MLEEKIEKWYKDTGRKLMILLGIALVVYLIFKFNVIGILAPFIIAWFFASLLNIVVSWGERSFKIHRGLGTIISMLTILSGILFILSVLLGKLWEQVINFTKMLPNATKQLTAQVGLLEEKLTNTLPMLANEKNIIIDLDALVEQIMESLSSFLSSIIPVAYSAISKVPNILFFTIAMLLATFFMTKDYYKIKDFVKAQFSDTIVDKIVIMQRGIIGAIGGYVRTQAILMSINFVICLVGLLIFGVEYALLIAVIIAFVDALPIFGSGAILLPWGVYNLLINNFTLAIGLFAIYGVIFVARQVMEPKILSSQIGVYALVTLMAVYIGYKTIGFIGLILGPALVVIIQMLQSVGALPRFKPVERAEGEKNENNRDRSHH